MPGSAPEGWRTQRTKQWNAGADGATLAERRAVGTRIPPAAHPGFSDLVQPLHTMTHCVELLTSTGGAAAANAQCHVSDPRNHGLPQIVLRSLSAFDVFPARVPGPRADGRYRQHPTSYRPDRIAGLDRRDSWPPGSGEWPAPFRKVVSPVELIQPDPSGRKAVLQGPVHDQLARLGRTG
jgi:hypothetical protein